MKRKLIALLLLVSALTGCTSVKYATRKHHNHVAQDVIQYEHSRPACKDPGRIDRHWSERPKGSWPFQFLQ